jgi:hypothetical protein
MAARSWHSDPGLRQAVTLRAIYPMIPFCSFHSVIEVAKTPYEIFTEIDNLDLRKRCLYQMHLI